MSGVRAIAGVCGGMIALAMVAALARAFAGGLPHRPTPPISDPLTHPIDPWDQWFIARKLERMPPKNREGFLIFMRATYLKRNR